MSLLFGPHCHNEAAQSHFPYPFIRIHPLIRITNTRPTTVQMDGKKAIIMCMRDKERPSLFFHKLMQAHVKHHVQRLAAALTRRQVLYLLLLIVLISFVVRKTTTVLKQLQNGDDNDDDDIRRQIKLIYFLYTINDLQTPILYAVSRRIALATSRV